MQCIHHNLKSILKSVDFLGVVVGRKMKVKLKKDPRLKINLFNEIGLFQPFLTSKNSQVGTNQSFFTTKCYVISLCNALNICASLRNEEWSCIFFSILVLMFFKDLLSYSLL